MIPDHQVERFIPQELREPLKAILRKERRLSKEDQKVLEASKLALAHLADTVLLENKDLTSLLGRVNEILDRLPERVTKRARETDSLEPSQNAPEAGSAGIEQIQRYAFNNLIAPLLSTKDLASLSKTSRAMRDKVGSALDQRWEAEKAAITIGPDIWKQVGFEVKDVPSLPKDIDAILKAECPYFKGKRVYQTHRLLLMPAGLSMNKQGVLTRHLREGKNKNIFLFIWERIIAEFGNQEIEKPYWVLVTKDVIPDSRKESFKNQIKLLKPAYQPPTILEATNLVTMNLEKSGERKEYLLPIEPWTYTRCIENIDGNQLVVGGFVRFGLCVDSSDYDHGHIGLVGLRKF